MPSFPPAWSNDEIIGYPHPCSGDWNPERDILAAAQVKPVKLELAAVK